jgi:hypothetical protein
MTARSLYGIIVLMILLSSCRWYDRDEFVSELRCGMTTAELRALAERYRVREFGAPVIHERDGPQLYLIERDTYVSFWLSDGRLSAYGVGTFKSAESSDFVRHDICANATASESMTATRAVSASPNRQ